MSARRILASVLVGAAALCMALPSAAQQMGLPAEGQALPPPPIVDPDKAMQDPIAADPVFWWRWDTFRGRALEPPAEFYWPDAPIAGAPSAFLPAAAAGKTTIGHDALDAMVEWAETTRTRALIVVHRGKVQLERYWDGVAADEITNARAITRGFTPMLLGFAVRDGLVDMDAPVERYLTEWKGLPKGQITVRQLVQNTSGLERDAPTGSVYGNKQLRIFYASDVVAAALDMDLVDKPGERFVVSEVNVQLLSIILERVTGKPLNQQLSEQVWTKIGASGATFQLDRPGGAVHSLCCMRATPRDLVRVGQLMLDGGKWQGKQVLPKGWMDTMATPSAIYPSYGNGMWLGNPFNAERTYAQGQPGSIRQTEAFLANDVRFLEGGGNRTMFIVPSKQLVILRLGYSSPAWDQAWLVNTAIRGMGR